MIINFLTKNVEQQIVDEGAARKTSSFSTVSYDASAETIYFYNYYGSVIGEVPTTDFVIDGMIEDVYLQSGSILTIIFNTESGKKDIEVDMSEFFNPEDYYTKEETDELINSAITESKSYTDEEIEKAIDYCTDYTDSAVTLLEEFIIDTVNSAITICNLYTDIEVDKAIDICNDYTDSAVTLIEEYINEKVESAITISNQYTDNKADEIIKICNDYTDSAITLFEDFVNEQVESGVTRANEYTDEAIANLSGGSIEVDLHYDSGSTNAQAGTAVAEAIETRQEKMVNLGLYPTVKDSGYLTGIFKQNGVLSYQSLTFSKLRGWIIDDTTSVIDPEEPYKDTLIPNVKAVYDIINPVSVSGDSAFTFNTNRSAGLLITAEYDTNVPRRATKVGKMVTLTFQVKGDAQVAGANWTYLGYVGVGYRPIRQTPITVQIYNGTNNEVGGGTIYANGQIRIWTNAKTATNNYQIRCNCTYESDW